jgi:hypothetical protein
MQLTSGALATGVFGCQTTGSQPGALTNTELNTRHVSYLITFRRAIALSFLACQSLIHTPPFAWPS